MFFLQFNQIVFSEIKYPQKKSFRRALLPKSTHLSDQDIMGMSRREITAKLGLDAWVGVVLYWPGANVN